MFAACLLQLAEIQEICCEFLKRQLDPTNCLGIRAFADTHSCRDLLRIADKFTQHNFQEVRSKNPIIYLTLFYCIFARFRNIIPCPLIQVVESEEFVLLPVSQLIDIISNDELNVRSEEQVYSAVMSWVKYNVSERRQHLSQVFFTMVITRAISIDMSY